MTEFLESRCLLTGPGDFVGDTLAVATNLGSLAPGGFHFENGAIDAAGDLDVYQFRTVTPGLAIVRLSADFSPLDTVVRLRDSFGSVVASNDDFDPPLSTESFLTFLVRGNETYFVEAGGFGLSTGDFVLGVSLDVIGATPGDTVNLGIVMVEEPVQRFDSIHFAGDFDVFQFQAGGDGPATFQLIADVSVLDRLDTVVSLLDSSGNFLATNDDVKLPFKNSLLTYAVQEGETYYIVASGFQSSTGGYALSISLPAVVDLGVLPAAQPQVQHSNTIEVPGDRDVFRFQADSPGLTVIQVDATNSSLLDATVTLLDSSGTEVRRDDDSGLGLNSFLTYSIAGGQTYYIVASGFGSTTGDYTLTVSQPTVMDLGVLTVAQPRLLEGSIAVALENDFYRFQAQADGFATVELRAHEFSELDTIVTVLDSNGAFLAFNDDIDFPNNTNSRLTFGVVAGQTYIVQAEGFALTTGNYSLSVSLPAISNLGILTSVQSLRADGAIAIAGETDFYRIRASIGGILVLELNSSETSNLDTNVTLRDSSGTVLAFNGDVNFPSQTNSRLTFGVTAGDTYFIEAGGFGSSMGGYHLNVSLFADNVSGIATQQTAFDLGILSSAVPLRTTNAIDFPLDRDVFQFRVDTSSLVDIQLNALDSRTLDTILRVLDSSGIQVTFNDDVNFPSNTNSRLSFRVPANQTFFIDVSGFRNGIGTYTLSASVLPVQSVTAIAFPTSNTPTQVAGTIRTAGIISQFRLAPAGSNQLLRVEVNAANQSLDPIVTVRVLSADGVVTSTVFDDDSGPGLNSLLTLPVGVGQILEIDVQGFGLTTGESSLAISTVTADNNVILLDDDLARSNFALRSGRISQSSERDVFRFTAASTSQVIIDLVATNRRLDPVLTVRDSGGVVVGRNDDSPFNFPLSSNPTISAANIPVTSLNSHLEINVTAGVTYDIVAQDYSFRVGSYFLAVTQVAQVDDYVDSFDTLDELRRVDATRTIQLSSRHELTPTVNGQINAATANRGTQDVDLLDFQANFTGVLDFSIDRDPNLNIAMSVFRDVRLAGASSADYELVDVLPQGATTLSIPVDELGIYVVRIVGLSGAGGYRLSGSEHVDQVPDSIANASPIVLSDVPTASAIDFAFDRDVYRFVGPPSGGLVSVSLSQTTDSSLDPLLTIYDSKGVLIASNDDVRFQDGRIDSLITFQAKAGAVYYLQAAGIGSTTGNYRLSVAPANGHAATSRFADSIGDSDVDRALLEAATTGLVSISNGVGMNGDRNPLVIRNAVVEAIETLAKQGKLTSNYLVLILDDAPEAGFVLTDGLGVATEVRPGSGVTQLPSGGIVNTGQFAQVVIVPTLATGFNIPMLQLAGFGSNLGNSFQASFVMRSGESQSLPQIPVSRSVSGEKVQLTFSLGFDTTPPPGGGEKDAVRAAIANAVPGSTRNPLLDDRATPSFFLMSGSIFQGIRASLKVRQLASAAVGETSIEDSTFVRFDDSLRQSIDARTIDAHTVDLRDLFEGVLERLQFGGLSRQSIDRVVERLRESDSKLPLELINHSRIVRSAKVIYEVFRQGTGWFGNGNGKPPVVKPRSTMPRVTQEASEPKRWFQAGGRSTKTRQMGG